MPISGSRFEVTIEAITYNLPAFRGTIIQRVDEVTELGPDDAGDFLFRKIKSRSTALRQSLSSLLDLTAQAALPQEQFAACSYAAGIFGRQRASIPANPDNNCKPPAGKGLLPEGFPFAHVPKRPLVRLQRRSARSRLIDLGAVCRESSVRTQNTDAAHCTKVRNARRFQRITKNLLGS